MNHAPSPASRVPRLWYGWVILGVVFLAMCTLIAVRSSFGVFFKFIAGEFGWSRAETAGAFSAGFLGQALGSPLAGWLMGRWGIRRTMAAGILATGLAVLTGAFIHSLWQLYLMYFLLCVGFASGTWVAQVPTLANWFVRRNGLAIGATNSAQGFALILNIATPLLIAALGWRASYAVFAALLLLVTLPLVALLHRDHPRDKGTVADAPFLGSAPAATPRAGPGAPGAGETSLLSLRFVLLGGLYAAVAYPFAAAIVHLVPYATDQGFTPEGAATLLALWGVMMVAANFASALSDRIGRTLIFLIGAAAGVIACVLLAAYTREAPPGIFQAGTALLGMALGLVRPTASSLTADHFAGAVLSKVTAACLVCFTLAGAAGPYLSGALYDATGSYRLAFHLMAGTFVAGAALAGALRRLGPPGDTRRAGA
ncbi:MAG: MFS transporter [Candidatus Rokubacteria bacterium]|nr:MFS transporter [Candidatus Rokubacteria bacterium]